MKFPCFFLLLILSTACQQQPARSQPSAVQPPAQPAAQTKPAAAADPRPAIVCFGDSLTAGYGVDPDKSYPDLLQRELDRRGYHYRVANLGESGDTTQDGLERLALATAEMPRIVVLEFGANDGLRGQPVSNSEANLGRMIEALQKAGAQVVLAGITLPPNYGADYIRRFSAMYPELAARYKVPLIPFLLEGVAGNAALMQGDGLHPNTQGTPLVMANVLKSLEPLLRRE